MIKFELQFGSDDKSSSWFRYSIHEDDSMAISSIGKCKSFLKALGFDISKTSFRVVEHKEVVVYEEKSE